ncbi:hypothetical protein Tco_0000474 [Tanacetum coccineum]
MPKVILLQLTTSENANDLALRTPGQIFEEPPNEEEILSFIRDLGHTSEIKFLSDVNVNHMHQPWRSFTAIINKCLSGKTIALEIIIDYFTAKDQAIPRRNKMFWHYARDDFMFTTIRVISKHQDTQTPKPKSIKKKADSESSPKTKLTQASKGKRIKTVAKKSSEEEDEEEVNVSKDNDDDADTDDDVDKDDKDDDADNQDDEIPDDANQDDDDEQTDSDNDGDDFVHPKLSTQDDEARQNDKVNEEESDEEVQGMNIEEEEMDEEATHEEDEANELYRDVKLYLDPGGKDTVMTNAPLPNANLHCNVPITTIAEPPLLSATTLPPTPLITHLQQTPVPTPVTVPTSSLQDLPNFGSLFGFDHRLKTLETDFSEFKQTNQFAEVVFSIPGFVDAYLANKMHEAVKTVVQLQSERLRDEAQAENADFLNKLDDNIKKIIKDQVKEQVKAQVSKILPKIEKTVNEQLEAEVMTRSSTESKTSLAIAANLSELELKKILIDKMESNKSIHRSDEQKNLYKALVDAYESDKLILDTYRDIVLFKRRRDDEDKDEEPSAGSNRGSKRR